MASQASCAEEASATWSDAPGSERDAEWYQIHTGSEVSSSAASRSGRRGKPGQQQRATTRSVQREGLSKASIEELQSIVWHDAEHFRQALATKASFEDVEELRAWAAAQDAETAAAKQARQDVAHMRLEWRAGILVMLALQLYSVLLGGLAPDVAGTYARTTPAGTVLAEDDIRSNASSARMAAMEAALAGLKTGTAHLHDSVQRKADLTQLALVEAAVAELQVLVKRFDGNIQGMAGLSRVASVEAILSEVQLQVEELSRNILNLKAESAAQREHTEATGRVTAGVQSAVQVQSIAADPTALAGRRVALFNRFHNQYVSMRGDDQIDASGPADPGRWPGVWGRFTVVAAAGGGIALHNAFHDRFIRLGFEGRMTTSKIQAWDSLHATQRWPSECFSIIDAGLGEIALRSEQYRRFVGMRDDERMDGDGYRIGPDERFFLVVVED